MSATLGGYGLHVNGLASGVARMSEAISGSARNSTARAEQEAAGLAILAGNRFSLSFMQTIDPPYAQFAAHGGRGGMFAGTSRLCHRP